MKSQFGRYIILILSLIGGCISPLWAYTYQTQPLRRNIQSLQVANWGRQPYYPVISLGSEDVVTIQFDDASLEAATYSYRLIHCNADWTPSRLNESDYLEGFSSNYIENSEASINTYYGYYHYQFSIPNENCRPQLSGNYAVEVYADNDDQQLILTACFSVVEPLVGITAKVSSSTDIDFQKEHQQVSFTVDYGKCGIKDPQNEIKAVVQQNQRKDNQVFLDHANYFENNLLRYEHNRKLIFEAGNEYRSFDISAQYVLSNRVEKVAYYEPYMHATLYPDEYRSTLAYDYYEDVAGRYLINVQFSDASDITADYFFTHFTLPVEQPYWGYNVYLLGEFTGNALTNAGKMQYNAQAGQYEKTIPLKQGGYNYLYLLVPEGQTTGSLKAIEGNCWKTINEYAIYVYQRPFGGRYDRLVGFSTILSNVTP